MPEPLTQIVHRLDPQAALLRTWTLTGGISAQMTVLEIALPDGQTRKLIVRQPGEATLKRHPQAAAEEFRLLQALHGAGLPVPTPYALDESGTIFPAPYLVIEYIEGQTDFAPSDVADYVRQMAVQLVAIHQMQDDFSYLPQRDDGDTLLHGDFWPGNVLWRDGKLVAVVDWEDAVLGNPLSDLAISRLDTLLIFGREAMQAFTESYQAASPLDFSSLPYWDMRAAERAVPHLAEWAAGYPALGRPDITAQTMRDAHGWFVAQAQAK
jgi:aminoglycoside phosphotransferase (APT) family kinase protein